MFRFILIKLHPTSFNLMHHTAQNQAILKDQNVALDHSSDPDFNLLLLINCNASQYAVCSIELRYATPMHSRRI